jgi:hypothetical protein
MAALGAGARNRAWDVFFTTLWMLAISVPFALALELGAQKPAPVKGKKAAHADAGGASGAAPVHAVASVKQLMAGLIDPAADAVWGSVGTIITAAGTEERRPRTDKEWEEVRNAALHLTEGGNLLMLGDRAKDHDAWWRMSRALVDAGAVALKAAEEKNVQALFDAGEGITIACDTCHGVYWIYQEEEKKPGEKSSARLDARLRQFRELR